MIKTYGMTQYRYVLVKHETEIKSTERYSVFACPSLQHLLAWVQNTDISIVDISEDSSDRERWRLERIGEALIELLPAEAA